MNNTGVAFPFRIDDLGGLASQTGDDNLKAKILEVLLTAPGERVMLPEFGCGLRDLVFDPNNDVLAATTEYTINRALTRWLPQELLVQDVKISQDDGQLQVEVTYLRRDQLRPGQIKIAF